LVCRSVVHDDLHHRDLPRFVTGAREHRVAGVVRVVSWSFSPAARL